MLTSAVAVHVAYISTGVQGRVLPPSSSCTCLQEPDCEVVGIEGLFNGGYDLSSDTLSDVSLIDIKRNASIESKADRRFGEDVTEAFTFNGIKTDCSCWSSCRLASLSVVTVTDETRSV